MKVGLIHHTEDYHKLCEMTARECYQSYSKLSETSENFIKGIMAKGHISVASTGNLVFGIAGFSGLDEYASTLTDLMTFKEINNYIRWTTPDSKKNPNSKVGLIVSMNMLTFLDINNLGLVDTPGFPPSRTPLVHQLTRLNWSQGLTSIPLKASLNFIIRLF